SLIASDCAAGIREWLAQPITISERQIMETPEPRTCGTLLRMPPSSTSSSCRIVSPSPPGPRPFLVSALMPPRHPVLVRLNVLSIDRSHKITFVGPHYGSLLQYVSSACHRQLATPPPDCCRVSCGLAGDGRPLVMSQIEFSVASRG